jgi:hypothetical protein
MTQVSQSSMDPEIVGIATRRQFSASEKPALVAEADLCKERGELGASYVANAFIHRCSPVGESNSVRLTVQPWRRRNEDRSPMRRFGG